MKTTAQLILVFLFLLFTGCCQDEIVGSFRLNTFEKKLIPYTSFQEISFMDNEGNTFIANSQPKESIVDRDRAGPESCLITEFEEESNFLNFQSKGLLIQLRLIADGVTYFSLTSRSATTPENNGKFDIACENLFEESIEERLTSTTFGEFNFQNVLIFQDCTGSSAIERIISSPQKGIEFIEFNNGDWFKLTE